MPRPRQAAGFGMDMPGDRCDHPTVLGRRPPIPAAAIAVPLALLVLAPSLVLIAAHGFAGLYGQDAFAYVDYALGPLRAAITHGSALPAFPFPPGYPFIVALASLVLGPDERVGQAVSLAAGASLPVLTAFLAWELRDPRSNPRAACAVAAIAGVAAGLAGQLWQSSVVAMSDTTAAAFAAAGACAVCRYGTTSRLRWLLVAAGSLAAAIDARWIDGLVAIPLALAGLVAAAAANRGRPRRILAASLGSAAVALVVLAPMIGPMLLAAVEGRAVPFAADVSGYPWDPANAVRATFETPDGRLAYELPSGLFYLLQPLQPYWFWFAGILLAPGLVAVARRPTLMRLAMLVGWPGIAMSFFATSAYQNTRFLLAVLPPLAILVALGAAELWRLAAPRPALRAALVVGVALALTAQAAAAVRFTDAFISRQAADLAAIRALEDQIPPGSRILSIGATPALEHDGRAVVELFDLQPAAALALVADATPTHVLVDLPAIAGQWAGRPPALVVEALRSGPGLESIDAAGSWTLLRVGP